MVHCIAVFAAWKKSAKVSVCAFKQIIFCACLRETYAVSFFCYLAAGSLGLGISTNLQHFSVT